MGCGASNNFDFKYDVSQQWESARKTIDIKRHRNKPVIKRSGWKTVRIFVSSTFRDFHAEREVLVKEVFPDLRQWCEKRRLHLVECDLRWGVPKDTTSEETLRTCLGEIDRCYQDNIMPFFLNMTCARCGWIPNDSEVPQSVKSEYRWIHGLSVTEMEIIHGAYRKDNPNSLFAIRDTNFLDSLPNQYKDDFLDSNPVAEHKLKVLKDVLSNRFQADHVFTYNCSYGGVDADTGKVSLDGLHGEFTNKMSNPKPCLKDFSHVVFKFFQERIAEQYPLFEGKLDVFEQEKEAHESFMKSRCTVVLGRNEILDKIANYVTDLGTGMPLILTGGPGSGKSSIMAKAADVASHKASSGEIPGGGDIGWHVFYHFVGAIPGSTDQEMILKRLLKELKICNDSNMPKDYEGAALLVAGVLSNPNSKPVIMFVDALNQVDEEKGHGALSWLPRELAPQVRCIFSMINDTPPHVTLLARPHGPLEVPVTPLDVPSRKEIVLEILSNYHKKLDLEQMTCLLSKESSKNPLWLAIACEELRVFGDFSRVTEKIKSLADDLLDLLGQVLTRFEQENGGTLMIATLCLLETSSHGLLETELLSVLGGDVSLLTPSEENFTKLKKEADSDDQPIRSQPLSAAKWAAVYRALRTFLRPFGDSGEGRLDFYHRSLSKAVRKKYFHAQDGSEREDVYAFWHMVLANFFENEQNVDRKVEEYPYHLVKVNDTDRLAKCLTEWPVFDHLFNEYYSSQLLLYWRKVGGYQCMEGHYRKILEAIDKETFGLEEYCIRYENIAKLLVQAGEYTVAKGYIDIALNIEEEQLGGRPERLVELFALYGELYDEISKLHEYINKENIKDLKPCIEYFRKSVQIRETLTGDYHKYKMGISLMSLSFTLNTFYECEGDDTLDADSAQEEALKHIEKALTIFEELGDLGKVAEATMTKAIMFDRGSDEQLEWYKKAYEQCEQAYGSNCKLMVRLISNIGIFYEDIEDYETAYEYYVKWYNKAIEVFGENHPKTATARNSLDEPVYLQIKAAIEAGN
ncbi:telomerase protein component 1-like isoform X1 [Anneissia japonica]|uniref:telomerase protein component 1-like isoform X1 n=1 Tax=Anneissia japonica TaxID=1529436 RepID=UPI0014257B38|nr:telomerase protein component 1-like isoform X1 [Anneissia japonica]